VAVKRLIGVVQQRPNLDFSLTAREILLFHGAYFGIDSASEPSVRRRCLIASNSPTAPTRWCADFPAA
jgi:ABC-type multidrug transport system ATPase subunit